EKTSAYETFRAKSELERTGIHHFQLIMIGIFPNHETSRGIFGKLAETQKQYVTELEAKFTPNVSMVPMQQSEVKGLSNIALLGKIAFEGQEHNIQRKFKEVEAFTDFGSHASLLSLLKKQEDNR